MRILHCCLACFYYDGYGYQENLLPKAHKELGNEVEIIASTESIGKDKKICFVNPGTYINENGITVHRLAYKKHLPSGIGLKIRSYEGLIECIEAFVPDIIFIHGVQSVAVKQVAEYVKKHPNVILYADNHSDYNNSAKGFVSRNILHGIFYKHYARLLVPYVRRFYGVLPVRCDFLNEMYGIPKDKIELLVMGADDDTVRKVKSNGSRERIRSAFCDGDTFLIIAGGKTDSSRVGVLDLMKAVNMTENKAVKLVVFGSVSEDIKVEFDSLLSDRVKYVGWLDVETSYEYMNASDLAVFPCLHSVMWEQAVGLGVPCIFHKISGTTHIMHEKNAVLVEDICAESLKCAIEKSIMNYAGMKADAEAFATEFSYTAIALKAIEASE